MSSGNHVCDQHEDHERWLEKMEPIGYKVYYGKEYVDYAYNAAHAREIIQEDAAERRECDLPVDVKLYEIEPEY